MQAIILNLHKDITLYNGETTTDRIIRLLNENNISYTISNTLPSNITKPTIIIENNLIFNNQLLHNYLNIEETINLLELNKHNTYRITNNYDNTYINTINDNNKDILNEVINEDNKKFSNLFEKQFKELMKDLDKLPEQIRKTTKKRLGTLNKAQLAGYAFSGLVLGIGIPNLNIYLTNKLDKKRKEKAALEANKQ